MYIKLNFGRLVGISLLLAARFLFSDPLISAFVCYMLVVPFPHADLRIPFFPTRTSVVLFSLLSFS